MSYMYIFTPKPMGDSGGGGGGEFYFQETSMKIIKAIFYVH